MLRNALSRYDLSRSISECRDRYQRLYFDTEHIKDAKAIRLLGLIDKLGELQSCIETMIGTIEYIKAENPFLRARCDSAESFGRTLQKVLGEALSSLLNAEIKSFDLHIAVARAHIHEAGNGLSIFLSISSTIGKLNGLPLPEIREEIQKEVEQLEGTRKKLVEATKRYSAAKRDLIAGFIGLIGVLLLGHVLPAQTRGEISIAIQIAYLGLIMALAYAAAKGKIKSISLG